MGGTLLMANSGTLLLAIDNLNIAIDQSGNHYTLSNGCVTIDSPNSLVINHAL